MEFLKKHKMIVIAIIVIAIGLGAYFMFFKKKDGGETVSKEKTELEKAIEWTIANDKDRLAYERKTRPNLNDYEAAKIAMEYDLRTNNKYSKYLKSIGRV
jgi:flagellar basal body-associated protein FliL